MNQDSGTASVSLLPGAARFDPIEEQLRTNIRATITAISAADQLCRKLARHEHLLRGYTAKYERTPTCLMKTKEALLAIYEVSADLRGHFRARKPI